MGGLASSLTAKCCLWCRDMEKERNRLLRLNKEQQESLERKNAGKLREIATIEAVITRTMKAKNRNESQFRAQCKQLSDRRKESKDIQAQITKIKTYEQQLQMGENFNSLSAMTQDTARFLAQTTKPDEIATTERAEAQIEVLSAASDLASSARIKQTAATDKDVDDVMAEFLGKATETTALLSDTTETSTAMDTTGAVYIGNGGNKPLASKLTTTHEPGASMATNNPDDLPLSTSPFVLEQQLLYGKQT